jgi:hypothetical protein
MAGNVGRLRRPAQGLGEILPGHLHVEEPVLDPSRHSDLPAVVPEMPLQLSQDRRGGEGRERDAPGRIEALERFEEPHQRHLHEVFERLSPAAEPPGQSAAHGEVVLHQPFQDLGVSAGGVPAVLLHHVVGPLAHRRHRHHDGVATRPP